MRNLAKIAVLVFSVIAAMDVAVSVQHLYLSWHSTGLEKIIYKASSQASFCSGTINLVVAVLIAKYVKRLNLRAILSLGEQEGRENG